MSGECEKCGEHALDCVCEDDSFYGKTITITGPVICNDGKKFEDYTWEEHLEYAGFSVEKDNEK